MGPRRLPSSPTPRAESACRSPVLAQGPDRARALPPARWYPAGHAGPMQGPSHGLALPPATVLPRWEHRGLRRVSQSGCLRVLRWWRQHIFARHVRVLQCAQLMGASMAAPEVASVWRIGQSLAPPGLLPCLPYFLFLGLGFSKIRSSYYVKQY